jgi:hypothetical protein
MDEIQAEVDAVRRCRRSGGQGILDRVSGVRKHLLIIKRFEGIPIVTAAQSVAMADAA